MSIAERDRWSVTVRTISAQLHAPPLLTDYRSRYTAQVVLLVRRRPDLRTHCPRLQGPVLAVPGFSAHRPGKVCITAHYYYSALCDLVRCRGAGGRRPQPRWLIHTDTSAG